MRWFTLLVRVSVVGSMSVVVAFAACQRHGGNGSGSPSVAVAPGSASPSPLPPPDVVGTPGVIRCGSASCDAATAKCCPEQGACNKLGEDSPNTYCETGGKVVEAALRCDDRTDCPAGQVCCWYAADSENVGTRCSPAPCELSEACISGSACSEGYECQQATNGKLPGDCKFQAPPLRCGPTTCSGTKSVCCWSPEDQSEICVEGGEETCSYESKRPGVPFRCRGKSDCGADHCCAFLGSYCQGSCINAAIVCRSEADCPAEHEGAKFVACRPGELQQAPADFKTCVYGY